MKIKYALIAFLLTMCGVANAGFITGMIVGSMLSGGGNNSSRGISFPQPPSDIYPMGGTGSISPPFPTMTKGFTGPTIPANSSSGHKVLMCCIVVVNGDGMCRLPIQFDDDNWVSPGAFAQRAGYKKVHKSSYYLSPMSGCQKIIMEVGN